MSQLLQAGLNVTAIGMGVVFVLLTMLVFIIRGMSALAAHFEDADAAAPASATTPDELITVISAAIAAHRRRR